MSAFSKYGITRITGNINEELMIVLSLKLVLLVERERVRIVIHPQTDSESSRRKDINQNVQEKQTRIFITLMSTYR